MILPQGIFIVEYVGSGVGYETIQVRPGKAFRKASLLWFVPRFDFDVGGSPAVVEVRVALWFAIHSFSLRVNDVLVYDE